MRQEEAMALVRVINKQQKKRVKATVEPYRRSWRVQVQLVSREGLYCAEDWHILQQAWEGL